MNKRFSAFAMLFMVTSPLFAAITLTTPEEIKVAAINGQELNTGLFSSNKNAQQLKVGENIVSVHYTQYFEENRNIGTHEIVRSNIVNIKTPLLEDNQNYYLAVIDLPKDADTAREYAKAPIFGLYNSQNQLLAKQQDAKSSNLGIVSNLFVDGDSSNKYLVNTQPSAEYTAQAKMKPEVSTTSNHINSLKDEDQQLIQIWKKATKAEKQKFMSWLAEQ